MSSLNKISAPKERKRKELLMESSTTFLKAINENIPPPEVPYVNKTLKDEQAFDYTKLRTRDYCLSTPEAMCLLIRMTVNTLLNEMPTVIKWSGIYIGIFLMALSSLRCVYSIFILVYSFQTLLRRTGRATMTLAEVAETAMALTSFPGLPRYAWLFGFIVNMVIIFSMTIECLVCMTYIAMEFKQYTEESPHMAFNPTVPGMPAIETYFIMLIIPCISLCCLRRLQWAVFLTFVGSVYTVYAIVLTIVNAIEVNQEKNPLDGCVLVDFTHWYKVHSFLSFSLIDLLLVIPIESDMEKPSRAYGAMYGASFMNFVVAFILGVVGHIGYKKTGQFMNVATMEPFYRQATLILDIIKYFVVFPLKFYVLYECLIKYIEKYHKPRYILAWKLLYKVLIVLLMTVVLMLFVRHLHFVFKAGIITFGSLNFVLPNVIYLLVIRERPGFGLWRWRAWVNLALILDGVLVSAEFFRRMVAGGNVLLVL